MEQLWKGWGIYLCQFWILSTSCQDRETSPGIANPPGTSNSVYKWTLQQPEIGADFNDVFFLNSQQGWVVGNPQVILATSNGGGTWPIVPSILETHDLSGVFFVDDQVGWVSSRSTEPSGTGAMLMSKMGGAYPTEQFTVGRPLHDVYFLDRERGWSAGSEGTLIHTTNGGVTWSTDSIGSHYDIFAVVFINLSEGWVGGDSGSIYHTGDGKSWVKENTETVAPIHGMCACGGNVIWACGGSNTLLQREVDVNDVVTWTNHRISNEPVGVAWHDIMFLDEMRGWIVGEGGRIYKTSDGGLTWTREQTGVSADLNALHMVSVSRGWAVGDDGTILTYAP